MYSKSNLSIAAGYVIDFVRRSANPKYFGLYTSVNKVYTGDFMKYELFLSVFDTSTV